MQWTFILTHWTQKFFFFLLFSVFFFWKIKIEEILKIYLKSIDFVCVSKQWIERHWAWVNVANRNQTNQLNCIFFPTVFIPCRQYFNENRLKQIAGGKHNRNVGRWKNTEIFRTSKNANQQQSKSNEFHWFACMFVQVQ